MADASRTGRTAISNAPKRARLAPRPPPRLVAIVENVDAFVQAVRIVTGGPMQWVLLRKSDDASDASGTSDCLILTALGAAPCEVWAETRARCSFPSESASAFSVVLRASTFAEAVSELAHGDGLLTLATNAVGDKLRFQRMSPTRSAGQEIVLPLSDPSAVSESVDSVHTHLLRPERSMTFAFDVEPLQRFLASAHRNHADTVVMRVDWYATETQRVYRTVVEFRGSDNGLFRSEHFTTATTLTDHGWVPNETDDVRVEEERFQRKYQYTLRTKAILTLVARMAKTEVLETVMSSEPLLHLYYRQEHDCQIHVALLSLVDDDDDDDK